MIVEPPSALTACVMDQQLADLRLIVKLLVGIWPLWPKQAGTLVVKGGVLSPRPLARLHRLQASARAGPRKLSALARATLQGHKVKPLCCAGASQQSQGLYAHGMSCTSCGA